MTKILSSCQHATENNNGHIQEGKNQNCTEKYSWHSQFLSAWLYKKTFSSIILFIVLDFFCLKIPS